MKLYSRRLNFFWGDQVRSVGGGAARQCGDQEISVLLLFARGRHYGAERAIRQALPRISSSS